MNITTILTCAVKASAPRTKLSDFDSRMRTTLWSINEWKSSHPNNQLIVVDGSGVDLSRNINDEYGKMDGVSCLFTEVDGYLLKTKGKGWAEGELIKFVLESDVGKEYCSDVFVKCTGKLHVANHNNFINAFNGMFAFDYYGRFGRPLRIDTRYYMASTEKYKKYLYGAHENVNEDVGIDLETAFAKCLRTLPMSDYVTGVIPEINGTSGSMGVVYGNKKCKNILKSIRNKISIIVD